MRLLLITYPFTQPNTLSCDPISERLSESTEYPAHFKLIWVSEVLLDVLVKILEWYFTQVEEAEIELDDNCYQIYLQKNKYINGLTL